MKIHFYLQDQRKKETFIYLSTWLAGKKFQWTTGEKIKPRFWSKTTERPSRGYHDETLSELLDKMEDEAISFFRAQKAKSEVPENSEFTKHMNLTFLREVQEAPQKVVDDVISYLDLFIQRQRSAKRIAEGTIKHFVSLKSHLVNFAANNKGGKLPFESINLDFFYNFTEYLYSLPGRDGERMKSSNVKKYVAKLKQVMREALEENYTSNTAFLSRKFSVKSQRFDRDYFTFKELVELYHCDIPTAYCRTMIEDMQQVVDDKKSSFHQRMIAKARIEAYQSFLETGEIPEQKEYFKSIDTLERVRDTYILRSFTGSRFSDFGTIKDDYFFEKNGVLCMRFRTKKSNYSVEAVIPIHPAVKTLFERYNYKPPIQMSNQKMNKRIKEMLRVAGFRERVYYYDDDGGEVVEKSAEKWELSHTHQTRNNFITNALDANVSIPDVMNITGLKKVETVMRYYRGKKTESALRVAKSKFFAPELFVKSKRV